MLPVPFAIGAALMGWFERPAAVDRLQLRPGRRSVDGTIAGKDWAHLVTSGLIWLALPLAIGHLADRPGGGQVSTP